MTRRGFLWSAWILTPLAAQENSTPRCQGPVIRLRGTVEKILLGPGMGMPSLEVRTEKETERVLLGSMRYLMEQNFNPAAGDEIIVDGVRDRQSVLAVRVEIPARKLRLELRDPDNCLPKWRHRGRHGMRHH